MRKQTILITRIEDPIPEGTNGQILVLEQYRELSIRATAIKDSSPAKGILLTGQPGVGMSSHPSCL